MWVWALRGSRHFEPMSYSVWPQLPHRGELIIVSLEQHLGLKERREVGVRVHLPGYPARVDAVLGAARPGDGAVHDRVVLPDVEVP